MRPDDFCKSVYAQATSADAFIKTLIALEGLSVQLHPSTCWHQDLHITYESVQTQH